MCFVVILWCEDITWVCCQRSMNISQRRGYFWSVQDKLFFCPTSREAANGGGGSLQRFSFLSRLGWRVQIVLTWLKRRQFVKMRSLAAKDDYYSSSEGRIEITGKKWNIFAHLILLKEMWELINIQPACVLQYLWLRWSISSGSGALWLAAISARNACFNPPVTGWI